MFLLRCFLIFSFFAASLNAKDNIDNALNAYYQSLIDAYAFYYEADIKTEDDYGKKIVDDSLTLDSMLDKQPKEESSINKLSALDIKEEEDDSAHIALYKEIKNNSYSAITKNTASNVLNLFKTSKSNSSYSPFMVNDFDFNILDYLTIYHDSYNFEIIKTTSHDYFYRGVLKPEIASSGSDLFPEMQIKFSKDYNIPTKIILYDKKNKIAINIEVENIIKIRNNYMPSKFIVYNNGKKTTISLYNIQTGIPIDIENNYKITLEEYINLTDDDNKNN
ncbi:MAG: outer membrane lipoprotein-sorting protein [Alphaproteobacteria bacterium]|nr:outer membrane lipoprotein-sorting protein [Alphaproteobacteria bacterium]